VSRNLESGTPRSLESGAQRVAENETFRLDETGRSISIAVTPAATTRGSFKNTLLGVSINSTVTGVDNKGAPGRYSDIGLPISIGCSVTTATHRADYNDIACLVPVVSTVTGTTNKRFDATGRSIAIVATMTATTRRKLQQVAAVPIVSTLTLVDNRKTITVLNHAEALYLGGAVVSRVYSGSVQVWP